MDRIQNQKLLAEKVLSKLIYKKIITVESVVAGGAPRNWEFGLPAKDIDIFARALYDDIVRLTDETIFRKSRKWKCPSLFDSLGPVGPIKSALSAPASSLEHIKGLKEAARIAIRIEEELGIDPSSVDVLGETKYNRFVLEFSIEEELFQLIVCDEGVFNIVFSFDFGINKIWMDEYGEVRKHSQFHHDKNNKTLTFYPKMMSNQNSYHRLGERAKKMKDIFPDFSIDIKDSTDEEVEENNKLILNEVMNLLQKNDEIVKKIKDANSIDEDENNEDE